MFNAEIKAKTNNPESIRIYLKNNNAVFKGTVHQIDTYFRVPNGKLKLREGDTENSLIYYEREEVSGPKISNILLHHTDKSTTLKSILHKVFAVDVVVDKMREIYFIENAKFHIDTVKDLGNFMEIECIDENESLGEAYVMAQCFHHLSSLGIRDEDLVPFSYSTILKKKLT